MSKFALLNLPETIGVALMVIAGEFGNGEEREKALKDSGYDYNKVQKCVNELYPIFKKYNA